MKRSILVAAVAMVGAVFGAAPAMAHQSPGGCTKNGLALNVERSQTLVKNGDAMTYTVTVANDGAGSCDITNATIDLILPARNGTPTGTTWRVVTGASYLAGFHDTVVGTVPYTVALDPGVTGAIVRATVSGVLHDVPQDTSLAGIFKDLSTVMPPPAINVTKSATPTSGTAPLAVTYTYTVTNTSPLALPVKNVVVTDDMCSSPVFTGGDADGDAALDVTETWTFSCTTTHPNPGTYVDTARACGDGVLGGEHVCAGPVQATVVVTSPPVVVSSPPVVVSSPPKVTTFAIPSVNSASAKPDAKCVATPKTLSVRAKELTTVRVTVSGTDVKGATVKITGPGFAKTAKTNAAGLATFKVRATKSGTIVIQSDRCLGADRVSVKAARKTQSRQLPRVTG